MLPQGLCPPRPSSKGTGANGSMYTFDFDSYGELKGLGRDADGESSIKGYWSGEGNVMFWMEKAGRIMTFCSGVYERSLEVGMRAGGR